MRGRGRLRPFDNSDLTSSANTGRHRLNIANSPQWTRASSGRDALDFAAILRQQRDRRSQHPARQRNGSDQALTKLEITDCERGEIRERKRSRRGPAAEHTERTQQPGKPAALGFRESLHAYERLQQPRITFGKLRTWSQSCAGHAEPFATLLAHVHGAAFEFDIDAERPCTGKPDQRVGSRLRQAEVGCPL